MSPQRMLASAALVAALAACALIVLRGHETRRYHLRFASAGLLVKGGEVQVGGRRVGSVEAVRLEANDEADVEIALQGAAPVLRRGTTASLEEPSLAGAANRYVAVNPGPNNRPPLPEGATIPSSSTTSVVEFDELYDLFDPKTRDALRGVVHGQRDTFAGRGKDAARFYATLAPALQASDRLFRELGDDGTSLRRFLASSGQLAHTLRDNSDDLYGAVEESARATDALAQSAPSLETSLRELPPTLREGRRSFASLRAALDTLQPFVGRAAVAGRGLPAFSNSLRRTLTGGAPAIDDLGRLLDGPQGKDLVALLRGLPSLGKAGVPSLRHGKSALRGGLPLVDQLRPYVPDAVSLWGNTALAAAPYDANGHYARSTLQFNGFREGKDASGATVLDPVSPGERVLGLQTGLMRRCPGGASQVPADGSAPLVSLPGQAPLPCDPRQAPPGP